MRKFGKCHKNIILWFTLFLFFVAAISFFLLGSWPEFCLLLHILFSPQKHLVVPNEKAIAEINENFTQMKNTFCAISKLEYLLEAVRLTYESIKDSRNPKKPMNDLGADGEGDCLLVIMINAIPVINFGDYMSV